MVIYYIVYFCALSVLTFLYCAWSMWQNSIDFNLIKKTNAILILKDGLPKQHLKKTIDLHKIYNNLDIRYCQHPCRIHFPNLKYPKPPTSGSQNNGQFSISTRSN